MRPCFAPCHVVNRSLMRCMPSSRSFGENRGASLLRQPVGRHRARHVLAIADRLREHAAQAGLRQRGGGAADAAGILDDRRRAGPHRFQRADGDHQRALFALKQAGGLDGQARGVGESEVLVEAALERRREVGVTVDQAREERLAAPVVDVGVRIRPRAPRRSDRSPRFCRLRPPAPTSS